MMLAVTAVCAVFCLSVTISGDAALDGDDEPSFFLPKAAYAMRVTARRQTGTAFPTIDRS